MIIICFIKTRLLPACCYGQDYEPKKHVYIILFIRIHLTVGVAIRKLIRR